MAHDYLSNTWLLPLLRGANLTHYTNNSLWPTINYFVISSSPCLHFHNSSESEPLYKFSPISVIYTDLANTLSSHYIYQKLKWHDSQGCASDRPSVYSIDITRNMYWNRINFMKVEYDKIFLPIFSEQSSLLLQNAPT